MADIMPDVRQFLKRVGYLFYLVDPNDNLFPDVNDVPDYYKEVTPVFILMIIMEQAAFLVSRGSISRLNDSITNICQGMLVELFKIPLHGFELFFYTLVFEHCRVIELPWDSPWTWLGCLVATDFGFYWMHRATHQISILWTFHEPHHSSEEFNLTVPLRLSVFTSSTLWLTYLPMALAVPPSTFFVHYQLNIIYQYWLHSEFVPKLGPIEWIFVTPTHHKVHHGRNRRCIDKNFGGFMIIWDRIFGTFEPNNGEDVKFGVVHPLKTFSSYTIQTNNLQGMWRRFRSVEGLGNKLSVVFKGPGWTPGTSWLGDPNDIPEPDESEKKYDPPLQMWVKVYVSVHLMSVVTGYLLLILNLKVVPFDILVISSLYIIGSTLAFGALLDGSRVTGGVEITRCVAYFVLDAFFGERISSIHHLTYLLIRYYRYLYFTTFLLWLSVFPHTTVVLSWRKDQ